MIWKNNIVCVSRHKLYVFQAVGNSHTWKVTVGSSHTWKVTVVAATLGRSLWVAAILGR
jgi:hypothetical protein